MTNKRKIYRKKKSRSSMNNITKFSITLVAFIIAVFLFLLITLVLTLTYNKVYGGIYLNKVNVSNMTRAELESYINEKYSKPLSGVNIDINDGTRHWNLNAADLDIKFNNGGIVDTIYNYGHVGNIFQRLSDINSIKNNNKYIDIWKNENGTEKTLVTYNASVIDGLVSQIIADATIEPEQNSINVGTDSVSITAGKAGYTFDADVLKNVILNTVNNFESTSLNILDPNLALTKPLYPGKLDIDTACNEINKDPVNAKYVSNGGAITIQPGKYGTSVDKNKLNEIVNELSSNPGRTYTVPIVQIKPDIVAADLKTPGFNDVLGTGQTSFSVNSAQTNRNHNIKLATETLNGTVIMPGDTFSFNKIIGDTTAAKGYLQATGYDPNGLTQTYGGGICQVSTTLYNAVIRSVGLTVKERSNHTYTVHYVPFGLDCMINYGTNDFKFSNDTKYPVKIKGVYNSAGTLTFEMSGINDNKDISYKFTSVNVSTIAYTTSYTTDSKNVHSGQDGGKYTVTRETLKNGVVIKTEKNWTTSTYRALNKMVLSSSASTAKPSAPSGSASGSASAPAGSSQTPQSTQGFVLPSIKPQTTAAPASSQAAP